MTVVDFHDEMPNALVPRKIDVDGFWDYVIGAWANVASRYPNA
jgi:inosine-uridine nucleoside N-ribohydrolase